METKSTKRILKDAQKLKSVRISSENLKEVKKILALVNKKERGRTVKFDQLLGLALSLLSEAHFKKLQDQSLSNADKKELLRQKWMELHGPISEDDFTGFTFTPEFQTFLTEHFSAAKSHAPMSEGVAEAS